MILTTNNEVLSTFGVKSDVTLETIIAQSKEMDSRWRNYLISNEVAPDYSITGDCKLVYNTRSSNPKMLDMTETAFSQLCQRVGVPTKYITQCFERGEPELAIQNLSTWIAKDKKGMMIRESDGVARAVLTDSYVPFDNSKILKSLSYTMDKKRFIPSQVFLSQEKLHIRFVDFKPLPVSDGTGSPLYAGFVLSSSSIGTGSFSLKFFIYRSVCTNGLAISQLGGTLFRQAHIGERMKEEKLTLFNKAFMKIDTLCEVAVNLIKETNKKMLSDYEMDSLIQKARAELKLSKEKTEKLTVLINDNYNKTKWGFINGVTELAQEFTLDTRYDIENWAGNYFIKAA